MTDTELQITLKDTIFETYKAKQQLVFIEKSINSFISKLAEKLKKIELDKVLHTPRKEVWQLEEVKGDDDERYYYLQVHITDLDYDELVEHNEYCKEVMEALGVEPYADGVYYWCKNNDIELYDEDATTFIEIEWLGDGTTRILNKDMTDEELRNYGA